MKNESRVCMKMKRVQWLNQNRHTLWDALPLSRENFTEEHEIHLKKIFNTMRDEGLYKCIHYTNCALFSIITLTRKLNAIAEGALVVRLRYDE